MTLAELKQQRAKLLKSQRDLHNATIAKRKGEILFKKGDLIEEKGKNGATEDKRADKDILADRDIFVAMNDEARAQFDANGRELTLLSVEIDAGEREQQVKIEELRAKFGKDAVAAEGPFRSLGEQLMAVRDATNGNGEARQRLMEVRAPLGNNSVSDSDGGFLLQSQFQTGLYQRAYSVGQILPRVQSIQVGADKNGIVMNASDDKSLASGSVMGGIIAYWAGEAVSGTTSKPTFRRVTLGLEKLMAVCYATEEMLQDSSVLESVVNQGVPRAIQLKAELAMLSGTGAGQCLGILNSGALISVSKETGQTAATIVYQNVLKMWNRMHADSRMDACWFINQASEIQLMQMSQIIGTGGVPVWLPAGGASGNPFSTLFGRPVIPVPYCAALGTVGDIVFADFGQYLSINKGAVQAATSIHVQFLTAETAFRFIYRINGQPLWDAAFTPLANDQTYSPYVALASRA